MPVFTLIQHKEEDEQTARAELLPPEMRERIFKRRFTLFIPYEKVPKDEEEWKNLIMEYLKKRVGEDIDGKYSVFEKTAEKPYIGEEVFFGEVKEGWWIF